MAFDKKLYMKEWRKRNKDRIKEYVRKYNENNPEKKKEYARKYYEKNKDKWKERQENGESMKRFKEKHDWVKYCSEARKRRVEKLRNEGCINAWSVVSGSAKPKYKEGSEE